MFQLTILILIIFILGVLFLIWFLDKKFKEFKEEQKKSDSFLMLNQNIQGVQNSLNQRLDRAAEVINSLMKEVGGLKEIGHQMQSLQDFLKSPKLRGNIGEQVLKDLLEQYFPKEHFELQYKFKSGERVDAILKTREGLIPIDSKFPMDNFRKLSQAKNQEERKKIFKDFIRDVKKHIDDISKKYILPEEKTVDFAIMYIPSEAIYYEIIRGEQDLVEYGREKNVLCVSPNSFYYFLKVIMMGMRGEKIKQEYKRMIEVLAGLSKDAEKLGEVLNILNTHLTNAKSSLDRVRIEHEKLTSKIEQTKLLK